MNTKYPFKQAQKPSHTSQTQATRVVSSPSKQKRITSRSCILAFLFIFLLVLVIALGALSGYQSITQSQVSMQTKSVQLTLEEQYELGIKDLQAGNYEVARQRFQYILEHDPTYPGVTEKLAESMAILYATATPTPLSPTTSPTATRDLRPVEDLFTQAIVLVTNGEWDSAIDTLAALRKEDRGYQVARVDGLLYLSLRNRGVDKIWKEGNLGGGLYDLSLAGRFGPLDSQATSARTLARLYLIGSSFWEVHPEQAVYYFSQVAAASPGLRDASNWTANERYRASLIHYGDLLTSQGDWCNAQAQYELALNILADAALMETVKLAALKCSPPSPTPELLTETATPTLVPGTTAVPPALSSTPTGTLPPVLNTPTPSSTTGAPPPSMTPTPTLENPASPTWTATSPPTPEPTVTSTTQSNTAGPVLTPTYTQILGTFLSNRVQFLLNLPSHLIQL